jgi:hypothetical protein
MPVLQPFALAATDVTEYTLDSNQFGALIIGLALCVVLLAVLVVTGWRR